MRVADLLVNPTLQNLITSRIERKYLAEIADSDTPSFPNILINLSIGQ